VSDTPIHDRLFRRWVRTIRTRAAVYPETVDDRERDLLTCAPLFWGDAWWREADGAAAA